VKLPWTVLRGFNAQGLRVGPIPETRIGGCWGGWGKTSLARGWFRLVLRHVKREESAPRVLQKATLLVLEAGESLPLPETRIEGLMGWLQVVPGESPIFACFESSLGRV
jgi:hypothetical protein